LGIGVANVIAVLYPELVVLGGDVANDVGPLLIDTVRREVRERVRLFPVDKVRIESSALQEKAGLWAVLRWPSPASNRRPANRPRSQ